MRRVRRSATVLILCCILSACSAHRNHSVGLDAAQPIGAGYRLNELSDPVLVNNPLYRNYAKAILNKLGKNAYKNAFAVGEGHVQLIFELASNGKLKEFKVDPQKTTASPGVIEDALTALKKSAPFPSFPDPLKEKYKELVFTVVLSYETESRW